MHCFPSYGTYKKLLPEYELVTKLPDNILAQSGVSFLKSLSVGVEHIAHGSGRMGTYYLEKGHGLRSSVVVYDRSHSVFCESCFEDYGWDEILKDADALDVTGITPALSDGLFDATLRAMQLARQKGIKVYFDVNYRAALLSMEKAAENFNTLMPYITHLIGNEEHLKGILVAPWLWTTRDNAHGLLCDAERFYYGRKEFWPESL